MRDTFALLHNDVHVVGILYNFVQGHDVGVLSAASQHLRLMPPACPRIGSHPVHTKSVITSLINNTLLARQLSHDHIRLALIPPNANPFDGRLCQFRAPRHCQAVLYQWGWGKGLDTHKT